MIGFPAAACGSPWRFGLLSLAFALLLAAGSPVISASPAEERKAPALELDKLRARIGELRAILDAGRARQTDLRTELASSDRQITTLSQGIAQLERRSRERAAELRQLEQREADLKAGLAKERAALAAQVRAAFMAGRQEQLKLLLSQRDPAVSGRTLVYYEYLNDARTDRIAAITRRLEELDQVRIDIALRKDELDVLRAQHLEQKQALEAYREVRAALLEQLNADLEGQGAELKRLLEDEQRLQQVLRDLKRQRAAAPSRPAPAGGPFGSLRGKLPWPVAGDLAAGFGTPRNIGELRWRGVFIAAPEGREVRAVARGRVVFADWLRGFGQLVIVDHGGGYMSLYGHNQGLLKARGASVEPGDAIATVGTSGGEARPGLYFEIRHNGEPVNPEIWCRAAPGRQGRE